MKTFCLHSRRRTTPPVANKRDKFDFSLRDFTAIHIQSVPETKKETAVRFHVLGIQKKNLGFFFWNAPGVKGVLDT